MKKFENFNIDYVAFSAKKVDDVAVINFKPNQLLYATDLNIKAKMFDYIDLISKSNSVKALVFIGSLEKTGRDEYIEFYNQILKLGLNQNEIHKLYHTVDQFIVKIINLNKMVVYADCGKIISTYLNLSLACDYRIVSDDAVFQNPYLELGMMPKGGGAFFLSKMLGRNKTYQILFSEADITANEAFNLGIVDKVVPFNELENEAIKRAKQFAQCPPGSSAGIKRLVNYSIKDLKEYLEFETKELLKEISRLMFEVSSPFNNQ
ncbi:Enoyl-CoA hydratase/isomerase family protein [Candidatus Magnetomoraceae bacterium gMMP-1]